MMLSSGMAKSVQFFDFAAMTGPMRDQVIQTVHSSVFKDTKTKGIAATQIQHLLGLTIGIPGNQSMGPQVQAAPAPAPPPPPRDEDKFISPQAWQKALETPFDDDVKNFARTQIGHILAEVPEKRGATPSFPRVALVANGFVDR